MMTAMKTVTMTVTVTVTASGVGGRTLMRTADCGTATLAACAKGTATQTFGRVVGSASCSAPCPQKGWWRGGPVRAPQAPSPSASLRPDQSVPLCRPVPRMRGLPPQTRRGAWHRRRSVKIARVAVRQREQKPRLLRWLAAVPRRPSSARQYGAEGRSRRPSDRCWHDLCPSGSSLRC